MAAEIMLRGIIQVPWRMASMRPRRMAAEISIAGARLLPPSRASMRPRRMAAEILMRSRFAGP